MSDIRFHEKSGPFTISKILEWTGAKCSDASVVERELSGIASLQDATSSDITYLGVSKYRTDCLATGAGAVFVHESLKDAVPETAIALLVPDPQAAFVELLERFYPGSSVPSGVFDGTGISEDALIDNAAKLEEGVTVEPGAIIGPHAEIGRGTIIASGAIIGRKVRIGRNCMIGPGASVIHALVGDHVIIHPGARIGQDGFGYVSDKHGHRKIPQIGRVVLQDHVEVGANSTIDRGGTRDTIIGEGSRIDNLVQIGHNVVMGRNCMIVSQTGISGSCVLGDNVVLGGKVGLADHATIGEGARLAACSNVSSKVPPGAIWGGTPAKPIKDWSREVATLKKLAGRPSKKLPNRDK